MGIPCQCNLPVRIHPWHDQCGDHWDQWVVWRLDAKDSRKVQSAPAAMTWAWNDLRCDRVFYICFSWNQSDDSDMRIRSCPFKVMHVMREIMPCPSNIWRVNRDDATGWWLVVKVLVLRESGMVGGCKMSRAVHAFHSRPIVELRRPRNNCQRKSLTKSLKIYGRNWLQNWLSCRRGLKANALCVTNCLTKLEFGVVSLLNHRLRRHVILDKYLDNSGEWK